MKIVIASDNKGKLKELQEVLAPLNFEFVPQSKFGVMGPEETGLSFIENAILKARYASAETDLPALADDSGLCVNALGGAPGIYSARYAGEDCDSQKNINKLLDSIKSIKGEDRSAHFYCALAFVRHATDPAPIIGIGQWFGRILEEPAGESGFGYDPIFFIPHLNCTAAQLSMNSKNSISHRAKALQEMSDKLKMQYGSTLQSQ